MIKYGTQHITQEDIDSVVNVLRSSSLTQGPKVPEFENMLSHFTGADYAFAVNSATSALHLACLALDVQPGDVVWTTPITFVASANCALYCGAQIDFVDIDKQTSNISIIHLEQKLIEAKKSNKLPKVVIPVHLAGEPCDMKKIKNLSEKYGFFIVEDASHAVGGLYEGKPIGSCEYSDLAVFSFHPVKIVTTGEGGVLLTNNRDFANKIQLFRSHGITRDTGLFEEPISDGWYYEQQVLGYNYRMSDLHAALGCSQLKRLERYVQKRHAIAKRYDAAFENSQCELPYRNPKNYSALHLYVIRIDPQIRANVFNYMLKNGVGVNLHYIPVHTHPFYRRLGFKWGDFPNSEEYYYRAISLPLHPSLSESDLNKVISHLTSVLI